MPIDVRTVPTEDLPAIFDLVEWAFGGDPDPDDYATFQALVEPGRTLAAYDDGVLAGSGAVRTFDMTVPGGPVPAAGVTGVGVSAAHRRRGVLRALMHRQLSDVREQGTEAFATLTASESSIYARFGYGTASRRWMTTVDAHDPVLTGRSPEGRARIVDPVEMRAVAPRIYDAYRPTRPGFLSRNDARWTWRFGDPPSRRHGASSTRHVLYEVGGEPRGYAWYRTKPDWVDATPRGNVQVKEMVALDADASGGLWRFLLGVDLMTSVSHSTIAPDDPVWHRLRNPRVARHTIADGLWVRLLDVPKALTTRSYLASARTTIEVVDEVGGWAAGRWTLDASPDGATCEPAAWASPDLTLSVEELGAVYLGDTSLRVLHEAGRVDEHTPGAVDAASRLFAWDRSAWCPEIF